MDYCTRHHTDLRQARSAWNGRRHPQLVRLHMVRHLVAEGRAAEVPDGLLEGELKPLTTAERYRRSGERRRELGYSGRVS